MIHFTRLHLVVGATIASSFVCLLVVAITVHGRNSTCWLPNSVRDFFSAIAALGNPTEMTIITIICAALSLWILGIWPTLVLSIGAYAVGFFSSAIKTWVESPRPNFRCGESLLGFGFPSGHVASSMFILFFVVCMYIIKRDILTRCMLIMAWLFATLISMSRLLLGVHSGADVAGGVGVAVAVLSICLVIIQFGNRLFIRLGINGATFVRVDGNKK